MWEPVALLPPVDAELLEAALNVLGDRRPVPALVLENEHPHAPRLAVAPQREQRPLPAADLVEDGRDRVQLVARAVPEEGDREVEILDANGPRATCVQPGDPPGDLLGIARWDGKPDEEP
jgi:hypothetical protein